MNCSEFQNYLQQRLDGETPANGADIERHLAVCRSCRELQAAAVRLIQALDAQVAPAPPDRFSDQLVSRILSEMASRHQARKIWSRRLIATAAVAACLLVALAWGNSWWQSHQKPSPSGADLLAKNEQKSAPLQTPAPSSLDIREAGSALVALVNRTADETVGQGRVLLPQGVSSPALPLPEDWQPALEPDAQSLREAQQGVAVGFEPVTSSARRAVNLFLREIPPMETSKQ